MRFFNAVYCGFQPLRVRSPAKVRHKQKRPQSDAFRILVRLSEKRGFFFVGIEGRDNEKAEITFPLQLWTIVEKSMFL
jgi:hypothetical protein